MNLREYFKKEEIETDTTESITNGALDFLTSFEEFSKEDKKFLYELDYNDYDIGQIEEINEEGK